MKRPGGTLLLAVVPVVLATGCGGNDSATVPTPAIAETSRTPNHDPSATVDSPAPPDMPESAKQGDSAGAESFVRHWFRLAEYAYASGDTAPLMEVASGECTACRAIEQEISRVYAGGGRFTGVKISVVRAIAPATANEGTIVSTLLDESSSRTLSRDGAVLAETPAAAGQAVNVFLDRVSDSWQVYDLGLSG